MDGPSRIARVIEEAAMSFLRLSVAILIVAISVTFAFRISADTLRPKDDRIIRATSAASVALPP